jgi:hypothetical protein
VIEKQSLTWPGAPVPSKAEFRVATLDLPYPTSLALHAGEEVTGRLVTVRATGPSDASFSLRHAFISIDLGLPGVGIPLDGAIALGAGRARVAVYTNRAGAAFVGLVAGGLAVGSVGFAVRAPDWVSISMAVLACGTLWWCYRRAREAVPKVVADALDALRTIAPDRPR